ncbi:hypothetical protein ACP3TI_13870, partial [Desulforudis sp. 1190]|uniref:hypothetical protein n=2 Tax=Candidatus Desulforudis TaxID=471826 RepID=UPI003CEB59CD
RSERWEYKSKMRSEPRESVGRCLSAASSAGARGERASSSVTDKFAAAKAEEKRTADAATAEAPANVLVGSHAGFTFAKNGARSFQQSRLRG